MNTAIICGSHRNGSQSAKVGNWLKKAIERSGHSASITDLSHSALPLWDEGVWAKDPKWVSIWNPIEDRLKAADSLVIISPEYAGMASPAIKNFFLFCGGPLVAHKPALLVAVSSGTGGSYPIQELRGSSYKNCRILYVPDHLIIRGVEGLMNDDQPSKNFAKDSVEHIVRARAEYSLTMLELYSTALKPVRESSQLNFQDFPFGL